MKIKTQSDWEPIVFTIVLALLFMSILLYSTHLEGKVAKLEARVSDLEHSYNKELVKIDQKVTRLLKAAGLWN